MTEAVLAGMGAISGGLGVMVLGLLRRNGNGRSNGALEAKMDEALVVLRETRTILDERLPRINR